MAVCVYALLCVNDKWSAFSGLAVLWRDYLLSVVGSIFLPCFVSSLSLRHRTTATAGGGEAALAWLGKSIYQGEQRRIRAILGTNS